MSAHIICVTSGGGLPIFARHKGNTESLSFSIIGSLNGVHMFAKAQSMEILNTLTDDYTVVWKEFHDSVIFIGIATSCTQEVLEKVLISAVNAMIMIVGFEEIKSQRNIERLKRELRVCYPIIDRLLDSLDCGDTHNKHSSDIVEMVEVILTPENHLIQIVLDSYTECIDSIFSCVLIHGKIAAATESWWSLHPEELKLLSLLATVENTSSSKDIPVFLPYKSRNTAFRFVTCTLLPDVQVCCLCGPTPSLEDIEHSAALCFKSTLEILGSAILCHPRNFSADVHLDSSILGMLLINIKFGKYMISRNPNQSAKRSSTSSHRIDILRTFFYQSVLNVMMDSTMFDEEKVEKKIEKVELDKENVAKETFWCSEYHKCHAIKSHSNILCVLYNSSIPLHTMRALSHKTLKILILDKQICW